jgi:hypothetical protein
MSTQTYTGTLSIVECPGCHMDFGITPQFEAARRNDHKAFYCPAGCSQSYRGKSEAEKLRDQLETAERRRGYAEARTTAMRDQLHATERSLRGHKAAKTRIKNRIAAGVCPCCSRSFQNLGRHMAGQHPDFASTEEKHA